MILLITMRSLVLQKSLVFILALVPFIYFVYQFLYGSQANPVEYVTHGTGDWALRFLLITLAISPLRKLTGITGFLRYRRMLGLFAFFYVMAHFFVYAFLDVYLNSDSDAVEILQYLKDDILDRPYITVGFTALLLLVPLAVTSTRQMQKRLGKNWKRLHRLVYVIAILGVLHYFWLVKKDLSEPLLYAALLTVLLFMRFKFINGFMRNKTKQNKIKSKKTKHTDLQKST